VAVAGGLMAASPGTAATPEAAMAAPTGAEPVGTADIPVGTYRIRNLGRPGHCMQRDPALALDRGPLVGMVPCGNSAYQRWRFQAVGMTAPYAGVRNEAGGCLDADRRGGRLTKVVHVIPCNLAPNNGSQLWWFVNPVNGGGVCSAMRICEAIDVLLLTDDLQNPSEFGFRVNLWHPYSPGCNCQLFYLERVG
jgi:hypothetical protein